MNFLNKNTLLALSLFSLVAALTVACEQPNSNGTANAASSSTGSTLNANANSTNANSSSVASSVGNSNDSTVDAKEPEKYQASVMLKLETGGSQTMQIPSIKADVARIGADRRMEFKLPTGETVIYLTKGDRQLLISPQKKQYAELNKESVGVDVRSLLMPEQIVNQIKRMKGVEQVGEEFVDGRAAIKYRFASAANTQSQAGRVESESFILVDKETGLPLRSFTNAAAQGNVSGVNALNLVTEMNNIRTDVDPNLFAEPTEFQKVAPEQIRAQLNALFSVATAILGQMSKSGQPSAAPNTTASPTPTP